MQTIQQFLESAVFLIHFKRKIWFSGIVLVGFAIIETSYAILLDNNLSAIELMQLCIIGCILGVWLWLKPELHLNYKSTPKATAHPNTSTWLRAVTKPHHLSRTQAASPSNLQSLLRKESA